MGHAARLMGTFPFPFAQPHITSALARRPRRAFRDPTPMPSLSQILEEHPPVLLLDAASTRIQAGLLSSGSPPQWRSSDEEAGVGVFRCLEDLGVEIDRIGAFAFCDGPGSILGIRTTAMALRMWAVLKPRPMYAYCSLAVVAQALARPDLAVIADARRGAWHHYTLESGLRRVAAADLAGEQVMPENFRHWAPLPEGVPTTSYRLESLLALPTVAQADLFRSVQDPDAFLHEEPAYATWSPQIHRAP